MTKPVKNAAEYSAPEICEISFACENGVCSSSASSHDSFTMEGDSDFEWEVF